MQKRVPLWLPHDMQSLSSKPNTHGDDPSRLRRKMSDDPRLGNFQWEARGKQPCLSPDLSSVSKHRRQNMRKHFQSQSCQQATAQVMEHQKGRHYPIVVEANSWCRSQYHQLPRHNILPEADVCTRDASLPWRSW